MQTKVAIPSLFVVAALVLAGRAGEEPKKVHPPLPKHAGLERFKQLAGEWAGPKLEDGKEAGEVRAVYKVTSNGSAVMETLFPGTPHEMVTLITPDGKSLALTHYCALGNQPHMKADVSRNDTKVDFQFTGVSNAKSEMDMHMHNVSYTFTDKNTLRADWTLYRDGKQATVVSFALKRKS
jgi:hypothetical protein